MTGAGRGIGREHALMLAEHGAKVVVNDLGGEFDGTGTDLTPAQQVVEEIAGMGGEAVANGDDVSDWEGAQRMVNTAIETFGRLDVLVNNAGILRDRMLTNMTEDEWDAVVQVHLKGTFAPAALGGRVLAGAGQGRRDGRRPHHQHHVGLGHLRQPRPDQLRRGQGRHRRLHHHRRPGAVPLRRHRQLHLARCAHPHDRALQPRADQATNSGSSARPAGSPRSAPGWPPPVARA